MQADVFKQLKETDGRLLRELPRNDEADAAMSFLGIEFFNDAYLYPYYLIMLCFYIVVYIFAILYHEIGHLAYFRFVMKKRIMLRFEKGKILVGTLKDYENMTKEQKEKVRLWGILAGTIPFIIAAILVYPMIILMLLPYFFGCKADIKEYFKSTKLLDKFDDT